MKDDYSFQTPREKKILPNTFFHQTSIFLIVQIEGPLLKIVYLNFEMKLHTIGFE